MPKSAAGPWRLPIVLAVVLAFVGACVTDRAADDDSEVLPVTGDAERSDMARAVVDATIARDLAPSPDVAVKLGDATRIVDGAPLDGPSPTDTDGVADTGQDAATRPDSDLDGVPDAIDNCPATANPLQRDADQDTLGDACDAGDADGDQVPDREDACPAWPGLAPDSDGDTLGDPCDVCPGVPDPLQTDGDGDGIGDACEVPNDDDSDGAPDARDNCPRRANGDQADRDMDAVGDVCDDCPDEPDPVQGDLDGDTLGDACDVCPEVIRVATNHVDLDGDGQPICGGDCDDANPRRALGSFELCDGIDNDCDGVIDGEYPNLGDPCEAGLGACHAVGVIACDAQGQASCAARPGVMAEEVCNAIDDDCDGQIDQTFDFRTNPRHCGGCGRACGENQGCRDGQCGEVWRDCAAILASAPGAASGVYPVDPDEAGPNPPFAVYCDMTTDGGGWTLCLNARYTAAATHLFTDHYVQSTPEGDPFSYYDFCPQDRDEYLFGAADLDAGTGTYRLRGAAFAVSGASPHVAIVGGRYHRVGVSFPSANIRWLVVDPGLTVDCRFEADPPKTFDAERNQPAFLFWEFIDPAAGGLRGFGRGFFFCSLNTGNPNEFVMEAGCHYGGCREPADFETNCWEQGCPSAPSNHVWVRTAGVTDANNRGREVLSINGDRIQAYFR